MIPYIHSLSQKKVISFLRVKILTYSHLWVKSYPDNPLGPRGCFTRCSFVAPCLYQYLQQLTWWMPKILKRKQAYWWKWVTWRSAEIRAAQRLPITGSFKRTFVSRKQYDRVTAKQDRTESIIIWSKNRYNRTINNSALLTYQSKCTTGSAIKRSKK